MQPTEHSGQRVCIFGGTFDPIHNAHLRIAEEALREVALERILFVPAGNPPHKDASALTTYEHRYAMTEIACAPFAAFEASRLEDGPGQSFTIDTVRRVRSGMKPEDRLFFLIGADAFDELDTWKGAHELVNLTEFLVVARPDSEYRVLEGAKVIRLDKLSLPVSSSTIRMRLAAGEPTPELPAGVRDYIERHGLYGFGQETVTALQ